MGTPSPPKRASPSGASGRRLWHNQPCNSRLAKELLGGGEMPGVGGVLETALYVEDLKRSAQFYTAVFGFEDIGGDQRLRIMNIRDRQILLLFKKGASTRPTETPGGTIPPTDGTGNLHLAFSISASDLEPWERWLRDKGVPVESKVRWERGGQSLYFRDPDGHALELATPGTWPIY